MSSTPSRPSGPVQPADPRLVPGTFAAPTAAQEQAWAAIADGDNTLVIAPTGSGKTLAAFLWAIDDWPQHPPYRLPPAPAYSTCPR